MPTAKRNIILPNHLTIREYAKVMDTNRASVSFRITKGTIKPTYVGKSQRPFIDYEKYKDQVFAKYTKK